MDERKIRMRKFEPVKDDMRKVVPQGDVVELPVRATKNSCGYDFFATEDFSIKPGDKYLMWSDVKVSMEKDEFLMIDVRSSLGIKSDLMLANTIGIGDADYYSNPGNDGNYGICLRNLKPAMSIRGYAFAELPMYTRKDVNGLTLVSKNDEGAGKTIMEFPIPIIDNLLEENTVHIKKGERICQGIFVKYQTAVNCNLDEERVGGFGSTSK